MHHDAAAATAAATAARLACRPLPGPDRVLGGCGGGARFAREVAAAKGPGHTLGCRTSRQISPLALISPYWLPPLLARLGSGFLQPQVIWPDASCNHLGHP